MPIHFRREVERLKRLILSLSAMVEENVWQAVKSVEDSDSDLAEKVIASDIEVDQMEVDVEEECLKILALHQPVAIDLRFIIAVLKMNNDLERIGDLAVNIAERAIFLAGQETSDLPFDFHPMAGKCKSMLRRSLDALVNQDIALAREIRGDDDEVDDMNREFYERVKETVHEQPERIDSLLHILSIARHLERIGDLATNIAEDVIYMVQGEIVRHKTEDFREAPLPH